MGQVALDALNTAFSGGSMDEASMMSGPLYHGSPTAALRTLSASDRGPLGPGVYTSPAKGIANSYAGPEGNIYELPTEGKDIYRGIGHRSDDEWYGFKSDRDRLIQAAEPDKRPHVQDIMDKLV